MVNEYLPPSPGLYPVEDTQDSINNAWKPPIVGKIDDVSQGYALPTCHCKPCNIIRESRAFIRSPWEGYDSIFLEDQKTLDSQRYLLCPRRLCGFILKSRSWGKYRLILPSSNESSGSESCIDIFANECCPHEAQFDVACCSDVTTNDDAFNSLVLQDSRTMGILKALVYKYGTSEHSDEGVAKAWSADFIENKGEGQIFLLHGSPGVGKSYVSVPRMASPPIVDAETVLTPLQTAGTQKTRPFDFLA